MTAASGRSAVPSEQRVFSLVLALVASPEGSTKSALLSAVHGYSDRYRVGEANVALDRQFERDKEQLRALGIQIETLDSPLEPGNNQLTRYRVSKERLEFPVDLRFSERELMLLRLAALAWSEGSLSAESRRAAIKLESLGAGLDAQHLGVAPRLGTVEPAAAPLQHAIDAQRIVTFEYTMPERETPLLRRVAPLRLHRVEGRWHLIAWDLDRDAGRVFLLSRVSPDVQVNTKEYPVELREHTDALVGELLHRRDEHRALVQVRRGSVAEARLAPRAITEQSRPDSGDAIELTLNMLDTYVLAAELVGYGADAMVCEPTELRELVVSRLRAVAGAHTEADHA